MSIAYYGSRISENMTKTPEGILICHNVPIGRSGKQTYLASELQLPGDSLRRVIVLRDEQEVFSPASMASFEGKPVTNDHPPGLIDINNMSSYIKGTVKNIRRGLGPEADLLLADLVIYDPLLIQEIENGKREVSSGYACVYEECGDGNYRQQDICGNHVAIVRAGRAGKRVAIKDSKESGAKMNLKTKILRWFFMDENFNVEEAPELLEIISKGEEEKQEEPVAEQGEVASKDEGGSELAEVKQMLQALIQMLTPKAAPPDSDPLSKIEQELTGDTESVTLPAEATKNETESLDTLSLLRSLKPAIAALPQKQRTAAADSLAVLLRQNMSAEPYVNIVAAQKQAAHSAQDAAPADQSGLGKQWAAKYHPERK